MEIYTVARGDTLNGIASASGIEVGFIEEYNSLVPGQQLVTGQALVLIRPTSLYTVRPGDTLLSIARANSVSVNDLWRNNPSLGGTGDIFPGQQLVLTIEKDASRTLTLNGYGYSFIEEATLRKTLPYLQQFTLFTYGFRGNGEIIRPTNLYPAKLAQEYGVTAVMHLSTLTEYERFDSALATALFDDPSLSRTLIDNIVSEVSREGYGGVDIDFEYVRASDAPRYVNFIAALKSRLSAVGVFLLVALAPKTYANQPGLLYEGHDYYAIGAVADYVLVMTYEWGYTYGPPQAVAPINKVAAVLDYAVSEIPASKIFMGFPNYGYDWALPFVAGTTAAVTVSNTGAVELAAATGSEIRFNEESASPYFEYTERGVSHIVHFEDARSVLAKLGLAAGYRLHGVSIWNIMRYFPQLYSIRNADFPYPG